MNEIIELLKAHPEADISLSVYENVSALRLQITQVVSHKPVIASYCLPLNLFEDNGIYLKEMVERGFEDLDKFVKERTID